MPNATNYVKVSPSAKGYGVTDPAATDILLLQSGDDLLFQNGVDNLLIELGLVRRTNYVKVSPSAVNYT